MSTQPQLHFPAPGQTPPPWGPGVLIATAILLAGCSEPAPTPAFRSESDGPAARALHFLKGAQESDGSFRGGASVPVEVSTAYVLGLLSASEASEDVDILLNRASSFLLSKQRANGAFGGRLATSVCLLALSTYQQRLRGRRDPECLGVEILEPGHVMNCLALGDPEVLSFENLGGGPSSGASFLLHALRAADNDAARSDVGRRTLEGQRDDGGWPAAKEGASDVVETAYRLRVLRLAPPPAVIAGRGHGPGA